MIFRNREIAGRALAGPVAEVLDRRGQDPAHDPPLVLGLPRGGVPVAAVVARALDAPLDVLVVRKLGHPAQRELAVGAIGEDGVRVMNRDVMAGFRPTDDALAAVERSEREELDRRLRLYRGGRSALALDGRTVVIVDDGIATGVTARVAVDVARARGAAAVVVAVPVAPVEAVELLGNHADEVVCLETPRDFRAVGLWYDDFTPTSDEEVVTLLDEAARRCG
ncbi:MAG: phosphoribosyltransferase family protein [Acidimicrobiia bacterium]